MGVNNNCSSKQLHKASTGPASGAYQRPRSVVSLLEIRYVSHITVHQGHFDYLVAHTGCGGSGPSDAEKIECLRRTDVATLMRATEESQRQ